MQGPLSWNVKITAATDENAHSENRVSSHREAFDHTHPVLTGLDIRPTWPLPVDRAIEASSGNSAESLQVTCVGSAGSRGSGYSTTGNRPGVL